MQKEKRQVDYGGNWTLEEVWKVWAFVGGLGIWIVKVFWGSSPPFLRQGIGFGVEAFVCLLVLEEPPQVA